MTCIEHGLVLDSGASCRPDLDMVAAGRAAEVNVAVGPLHSLHSVADLLQTGLCAPDFRVGPACKFIASLPALWSHGPQV